jgi:ketosteroid isomerase-like protein
LVRLTFRLLPLALVILLLGGCASSHPLSPDNPEGVLHAFVAALNHADIDTLTDLFDPNATAFLPLDSTPAELIGRDAIRGAFISIFRELRQGSAGPEYMHLVSKRVITQRSGDAFAIVTFDAGAGPVVSRRTLVVMRTASGWRILHFHGSNIRMGAAGAGA